MPSSVTKLLSKILGQGWELSVFQSDERLTLSIPVDSGFVSRSFEFTIEDRDLDALRGSRFRHKVLEYILHSHLQPSILPGGPEVETCKISGIIDVVLHGTSADMERQIDGAPEPSYIRPRIQKENLPN